MRMLLVICCLLVVGQKVSAQVAPAPLKASAKITSQLKGLVVVDGKRVGGARPATVLTVASIMPGVHVFELRGEQNWLQVVDVKPGEALALTAKYPGEAPPKPKTRLPEINNYKDPIKTLKPEELAWYQQATAQTANEEFASARITAQTWLKQSPANPVANYLLGNAALEQALDEQEPTLHARLLEEAKQHYMDGLVGKGLYVYNYAGLAKYYALQKDIYELNALTEQAQAVAPTDVNLLITLAEAQLLSGTYAGYDDASTLLTKALGMDGKNVNAYLSRGDIYLAQNIDSLPLYDYTKALALDPNSVKGLYRQGQYYNRIKKYPEGATALKKAISLDPKFAPAYAELGELYFRFKQYQQAKDYYKQYVALRKNDLSARYRYAQVLYTAEQYQDAVNEINTILKDTATNVIYRIQAYSYTELGQTAEARKALDTYLSRIKPENIIPKDYEYKGKIELKEGKTDVGVADILKAIELDSSRVELFQEAVKPYLATKQYDLAARYQRLAIGATPTFQNYYTLARIQNLAGQYASADSAFTIATKKAPGYLPLFAEAARNAFKLDPDYKEGKPAPYYERVVELGTKDEAKYKKELVEAYSYLGFYTSDAQKDNAKALGYYEKVLALDPDNAQAKAQAEYLRATVKAGK